MKPEMIEQLAEIHQNAAFQQLAPGERFIPWDNVRPARREVYYKAMQAARAEEVKA